jgi:drug/metabolite transporter (DMT)-like permease
MNNPPRFFSPENQGLLLVAGSAIAWSTAGYFTRLIDYDVWTILFWRGLFGGIAIFGFLIFQSRRNAVSEFFRFTTSGSIVAVLSAIGMISFVAALKLTTVANVSLVYAASPFVTAIFARAFIGERLSFVTMLSATLAFVGIAIMFSGMFSSGNLIGIGLSILMTVSVSTTTVLVRKSANISMTSAVCWAAFLGSILSAPFASPLAVSTPDIFLLAAFGFCQMGLGLVLYVAGCRLAPSGAAAVVSTLETPLAPFWVWLAFGEFPTKYTIVGGGVILVAVVSQIVFDQIYPVKHKTLDTAEN